MVRTLTMHDMCYAQAIHEDEDEEKMQQLAYETTHKHVLERLARPRLTRPKKEAVVEAELALERSRSLPALIDNDARLKQDTQASQLKLTAAAINARRQKAKAERAERRANTPTPSWSKEDFVRKLQPPPTPEMQKLQAALVEQAMAELKQRPPGPVKRRKRTSTPSDPRAARATIAPLAAVPRLELQAALRPLRPPPTPEMRKLQVALATQTVAEMRARPKTAAADLEHGLRWREPPSASPPPARLRGATSYAPVRVGGGAVAMSRLGATR